ncbi:MAG: enoyl-CoA hydratase/isomerase family protein [Candidatus Bathyarchaeota archaeon]|nr:MAG: enoyl-CoA hydratase/isomerase family protein [Candidatus Bathyarchaeota archaeon]
MSQDFRSVICKVENGVSKIIINKPPLNVLTVDAIEEITSMLEKANADENIYAVIITGIGDRAFSAGVDISAHLPDKIDDTLSKFHRIFHLLTNLHKPSIAMVNGLALGGGCELAIACDMVVAADEARFGQPEIKVGAIPTVAAALLPKLIGRKKALELIFTGDTISAAEAKEMGLVNKVVPAEKLAKAVDELVRKLKDLSPIVLKLVRKAAYQAIDVDFVKALDGVTDIYLKELMQTEDAVEGLKAFLEKRKPTWKGK